MDPKTKKHNGVIYITGAHGGIQTLSGSVNSCSES